MPSFNLLLLFHINSKPFRIIFIWTCQSSSAISSAPYYSRFCHHFYNLAIHDWLILFIHLFHFINGLVELGNCLLLSELVNHTNLSSIFLHLLHTLLYPQGHVLLINCFMKVELQPEVEKMGSLTMFVCRISV